MGDYLCYRAAADQSVLDRRDGLWLNCGHDVRNRDARPATYQPGSLGETGTDSFAPRVQTKVPEADP